MSSKLFISVRTIRSNKSFNNTPNQSAMCAKTGSKKFKSSKPRIVTLDLIVKFVSGSRKSSKRNKNSRSSKRRNKRRGKRRKSKRERRKEKNVSSKSSKKLTKSDSKKSMKKSTHNPNRPHKTHPDILSMNSCLIN